MGASGYCVRCQCEHAIPTTPEALAAAAALIHTLETTGRVDYDGCSLDSQWAAGDGTVSDGGSVHAVLDPRLSVQRLVEERGKMLGVLVCFDPRAAQAASSGSPTNPSSSVVVLKAFSGKLNGHWTVPGWAPALYGTAVYGGAPEDIPLFAALQREVAEAMAQEAHLLEARGKEYQFSGAAVAAKLNRQALSRQGLAVLRNHQTVANFRGEARTVAQAHLAGEHKVPVGTGDCCATKLVAAAQVRGLVPLGIAEFYFGKRARLTTRVAEGVWYDACEQRCQQVLGFMLCGLDEFATTGEENSLSIRPAANAHAPLAPAERQI
jgi:hypothetical protein